MLRRRTVLVGLGGGGVALAGCAGVRRDGDGRGDRPTGTESTQTTERSHTMTEFTTPAFEDGASVPTEFTCSGRDVSPPLEIESVPDDAKSLAIVVDDPDAPSGTFTHWLLWNLPPGTTTVPKNVPQRRTVGSLDGARQGTNGFGEIGYRGPCPPKGDGPHTYRFTLYLLERELQLDAGAKRAALFGAMDGNRLGRARFTAAFGRR
ncbi:YbhB/YbcL family Raf kinase inhibitor-like protein [Haladaptatus sp. T7]|uniref:YbhB/YbcL family Raf kinase inhibitor-like protein n=1 Tax=Haladaptatus sp. T7 TaxID=2029368 RepID=UPI00222FFB10|nr:YbhB/YbcL family Raf kinase inhibitor-like protein [Haladaptatus sp. T7]